MQLGLRRTMRNLAFRSKKPAVNITEHSFDLAQPLTPRDSELGTVQRTANEVQRTLSLPDIEHGSLKITDKVENLIDSINRSAIQFIDENGDEFTCWVDKHNSLLCGFREWFVSRNLTYGDRIILYTTNDDNLMQIYPTGDRDNRVFEEAKQHEDLDRVLESARKSGKSYHDLII